MICDLDLRSDTFSIPCAAMRSSIANAVVGDDVFGEDPTINSLEYEVAELLGKEAGLFVPSGTMGNGLAVRTLTSPGDRVLCGTKSHVYNYEGDQFALNCGVQMHRIDEQVDGLVPFTSVEKETSLKQDIHRGAVSLLSLENTHNLLGGRILPQSKVIEICDLAHSKGLSTFLDGARLWHAHAATGKPLSQLASPFDMLSVCFSKAMGAPVGSVVTGSSEMISRARWFRKRMGGGMRQAGILGAACQFALKHNLHRLKLTHDYARMLAEAFKATGRFTVDIEAIETNIVFLGTEPGNAENLVSRLKALGLHVLALDNKSVRFVTHLSLDPKCVDEAVNLIEKEL